MGRIYFLKTPEKRTIFPATRSEAVLYKNTTVDKAINKIQEELDGIQRIEEVVIDAIVSRPYEPEDKEEQKPTT